MFILDFIVSSILVIGVVFGNGEVNLLSMPPSIAVRGHEIVDSVIVSNMMAAAVGYTTDHLNSFQGMSYKDPWNLANSIAVVAIRGPKSLGLAEGHTFPLQDSNMEAIRNSIESKMYEHNPFAENQTITELDLVDGPEYLEMMLNKGKLPPMKQMKVFHLNTENVEDKAFIDEMILWRAVLTKLQESGPASNSQPDLYWFNVRTLHAVNDMHGENSVAAKEASDLVRTLMKETKIAFEQIYGKKTFVVALTSDSVHTRRFRRASEIASDRNLATEYDENYPVIFNIFLWFTIAFIMSLIAISMVTACMDPGRDSIIYRMTSTRMKKDN